MNRWIAAWAFAGLLSFWTGCATTQQQEDQAGENENQENQQNQGDNASNNENANGALNEQGDKGENNGGNNANLEPGNEADLAQDGDSGQFVNNADDDATFDQGASGNNMLANNGGTDNVAMMEEGAEGQDVGANVNNATEGDDFGMNNTSTMEAAVPVEQPAVDTGVNAVVDQSADMAPAAVNDPMAGAMPGSGVVRYVPEGGTQLYSDQERRNVVKNLEQGDHPLVVENGEWARTSDGYYISANGLTPRPIGRFKPVAEWQ